jgi:adenylate cyclase
LTIIFVDVRGSTALAESVSSTSFSKTLNQFYSEVSDILVRTDAFIDKFVGDEVMGVYLPIFAGSNHAEKAVTAATEILHRPDSTGDRLTIGVGVHTGAAFFGTVAGAGGIFADFTALGDTVNVAARLVSAAAPGEALISDATLTAAGIDMADAEHRVLELKGKTETIGARVATTSAQS